MVSFETNGATVVPYVCGSQLSTTGVEAGTDWAIVFSDWRISSWGRARGIYS